MSLVSRIKSWLSLGSETSFRQGYGVSEYGNWFALDPLAAGWQRDLSIDAYAMRQIPVVAAARHLYRSAFAQLRPAHNRYASDGTVTAVETSAASRVLYQPNSYESGADLFARMVDSMIVHGEVLLIATRNDRSEIAEMHLVPNRAWTPTVERDTKAIYYAVRESEELIMPSDADFIVPSRDVLHLKWATPRHPLIGETPLAAAGLAAGVNVALTQSQAVFFSQMRRPSGVLTTDMTLSRDQIRQLREAFDDQAKNLDKGGIPILAGGLKFQPMSISSQDAEVISALRMSNEEVARALGVPPPLLGDLSNATLSNVEALFGAFLSMSLGGLIERFERGFDRFFGLNSRSERIEMDVTALLRTDLAARMDALARGVQGGIMSPNEARKREGLSPVEGGDMTFLQRQNTPIDLLSQLAANELAGKAAGPANDQEEDNDVDPEVAKALVVSMRDYKRKAG